MIGTLVNAGAVVAGGLLGAAVGERVPERYKTGALQTLGLGVVLVGLQMCLPGKRPLLAIGSLIGGGLVGEACRLEERLQGLGHWLRKWLGQTSGRFAEGFASATVLFCTGAMMIVGSIEDGLRGDPGTLYVKALLDGVASVALGSSLGIGVAFSALSVLVAQGAVTLLAGQLEFLQAPAVLDAVSATGGMVIAGIGLNLLGATQIRTGNLMPAVVVAAAAGVLL